MKGLFSLFLVIALPVLEQEPHSKINWAQEPTAFRNVSWGTGEKEADKIADLGHCFGKKEEKRMCQSLFKIGDVGIDGLFIFTLKDGFCYVLLQYRPEDYNFLKSAFIEKYGPPMKSTQEEVENRMGAKFLNETAEWQGSKISISLSRYGSKVSEGLGSIGLTSYIDGSSADRDAKQRKQQRIFESSKQLKWTGLRTKCLFYYCIRS